MKCPICNSTAGFNVQEINISTMMINGKSIDVHVVCCGDCDSFIGFLPKEYADLILKQ